MTVRDPWRGDGPWWIAPIYLVALSPLLLLGGLALGVQALWRVLPHDPPRS